MQAAAPKDALHLIVVGPPGAGKGTQCGRLAAQYNLEHISCGELMRHEKAVGSLLGQYLDDHWQVTKLSAIATDLATKAIKKALASGKGFILDGSPRTDREAAMLAVAFAENGIGIDGVIELTVDQSVATKRLLARRVHQPSGRIYNLDTCPPRNPDRDDITGEELTQRTDDVNAEGVAVRFCSYNTFGTAVRAFFKEKPESGLPLYFEVDTNPDVEAVSAELQRVVSPLLEARSKRAMSSPLDAGPDDESTEMAGGQRVGAADSATILQHIRLLVRSSKPASRFPGSHPVALTSKNIKVLLDDDYRVAPKIDGERRFLVLLDQRLYLVNRRMRVELFPAVRFPARYNRTIFDGEVVPGNRQPPPSGNESESESEKENENESESESESEREKQGGRKQQWYFVIFDVLCAGGEYVCHMPLHDRLDLAKPVVELLAGAPFALTFQDYHPLDRIRTVFAQQHSRGRKDDGSADVVDTNPAAADDVSSGAGVDSSDGGSSRSNSSSSVGSSEDDEEEADSNASFFPTDGLLFVPVYTPYRLGYCERMMKWKPPAQNTIDFTLRSVRCAPSEAEGQQDRAKAVDLLSTPSVDAAAPTVDKKTSDSVASLGADDSNLQQQQQQQQQYWQLFVLQDSNNYLFYDWIELDEDEAKRHGIDDGCIVECHWDPAFKKKVPRPPASLLSTWGPGWSSGEGGWRFHRVRRDKKTPNAEWVVRNIEESIWDNLEEKDITGFVDKNASAIRRLLKEGPRFLRNRSSGGGYVPNSGGRHYSAAVGKPAGSRYGSDGSSYRSQAKARETAGGAGAERWERGSGGSGSTSGRRDGGRPSAYGGSYKPRGDNAVRVRSASVPNEGSDGEQHKQTSAVERENSSSSRYYKASRRDDPYGGRGEGGGSGGGGTGRQNQGGGDERGGRGWGDRGSQHHRNRKGEESAPSASWSAPSLPLSASAAVAPKQEQRRAAVEKGGKEMQTTDGWTVVGKKK